jgi:hypothetical protein
MHYALTIRIVHFSLKIRTAKISLAMDTCHVSPCRGSNHQPTTLDYPRLRTLYHSLTNVVANPCSICRNFRTMIFLVLKLSAYTENSKTAFKAVLTTGASPHSIQCCVYQYNVVFTGHDHLEYGIESAQNSRHLSIRTHYF